MIFTLCSEMNIKISVCFAKEKVLDRILEDEQTICLKPYVGFSIPSDCPEWNINYTLHAEVNKVLWN